MYHVVTANLKFYNRWKTENGERIKTDEINKLGVAIGLLKNAEEEIDRRLAKPLYYNIDLLYFDPQELSYIEESVKVSNIKLSLENYLMYLKIPDKFVTFKQNNKFRFNPKVPKLIRKHLVGIEKVCCTDLFYRKYKKSKNLLPVNLHNYLLELETNLFSYIKLAVETQNELERITNE